MREKDGLWAVLLWLNILAMRKMSVADIMADHWARFGRNYYSRHDYEAVPTDAANTLMADIRTNLSDLPGRSFAGLTVEKADEFAYRDPVDGSLSEGQGLRLWFEGGSRGVLRLSGTGTDGATLRVYLEQYADTQADHGRDAQEALAPVRDAVAALARIEPLLGRDAPDVMT